MYITWLKEFPSPLMTTAEFKWVNMPGIDMDKVSLVLDFGGCGDNTVVNVSKIHLQEHHE